MKSFNEWMTEKHGDNKRLYMSLVPKDLIKKRETLIKMVNDAYKRGDQKNAERLDAQLEELEDKIDNMLEDMDDSDGEDIETGNTGGEESHLDKDWSVQEEMARIYAQYLAGKLDIDNEEDTVEVDPEEAKRMGWEYRQAIDHNGKPANWFYRYAPTSKQANLAKIIRGAIWEAPNLSNYGLDVQKIKNMTDEEIIGIAKDAYDWKKNLRDRIKSTSRFSPSFSGSGVIVPRSFN